jgi:hypothetical protein
MSAKAGIRQSVLSLIVFVIVLAGLVSVDTRVREGVTNLASGGDSIPNRVTQLGGAVVSAIKHQSIDNAPLLVFATVGTVLFLFMVRS